MPVVHLASPDGTGATAAQALVPAGQRPRLQGLASIEDVLEAVASGRADRGVVPLEDSHHGLHAATVDGLAFATDDVVVVGEVDLVAGDADGDGPVTTRWVALATSPAVDPEDPQTLLFVIPRLNRPGTLLELLAAFSSRGLNLTRFSTRPLRGVIGMYGFLLEVEGSPSDEWVADALADVLGASSHLKFLGTFAAGERRWSTVTGLVPAGTNLRTLDDLDDLVRRLSDVAASDHPDAS